MVNKQIESQADNVDLNAWEEELKFIRQRQKDFKGRTLQAWEREDLYDRWKTNR